MESTNLDRQYSIAIPGLFVIVRLIMVISLPLEGLRAYGDFWNFYYLAGLGWPFFDHWVEFPPLFPFLSRGIYLMVGGREHAYIYLSVLLFSVVQAGSLYLFQRIAALIWGSKEGFQRTVVYAMLTVGLFYGWSYFDPLGVFLGLLGLFLAFEQAQIAAGLALGLGGLVKWFPVLFLPAVCKWMGKKGAVRTLISAVLLIGLVWGVLYLSSPDFTEASLRSQGSKGSWETVWAIIDGNFQTGNFTPDADRMDPETISISTGNPAVISPWITLLFFGGAGGFLFWRASVRTEEQLIAFSGLTVVMFFLWSPGYSPQWVLLLIPLILLGLEQKRSMLVGLVVLLINLLEWPVLL